VAITGQHTPSAAPPPPPPPGPLASPPPPTPTTDGVGGTLSIVATDIVGSTAIAETLGDQGWLQVLRAHNHAVREQLTSHHGTEVKQSGDGFLATFRSARDAVRAAVAIRQAIGKLDLPDETPPLRLRIGVHAGELEHDGHDVYGVNVSTACRIASVAEPDEILVSGVVRELAASTSDLSFGTGREVQLAGRAYPIKVHPTLA
jgi:class 3 adenylate cyclase